MNKPKRHHWWPQVQSRHWTQEDGCVCVTRKDGTTFRANPINVAVESELYTRFGADDSKDTWIEEWFGNEIDAPAGMMINHLLDPTNIRRRRFTPDSTKATQARALGFRVYPYLEEILLPDGIRTAIARYVAALLVRHPDYLRRLASLVSLGQENPADLRSVALDQMLVLYEQYRERIERSVIMVSRRIGSSEYLYADGGLMVKEPWNQEIGVPFDIHAPLTPDIAIQILPTPEPEKLPTAIVFDATNQGVSRQNRIILGGARRFVFSRQTPPKEFIGKNFGVPAPANICLHVNRTEVHARYDASRELRG